MANADAGSTRPVRVFVSYSHRDAEYLDEDSLLGFLRGLERHGVVLWTDRRIKAGERWEDAIGRELTRCDIALALVSQAFLDSPYCQDVEIRKLLARRTTVLPLILSPCDWQRHAWLAETQALPRDGRTVEEHFTGAGPRKRLFLDYREALQAHIDRLRDGATEVVPGVDGVRSRLPSPPELFVGRDDTVAEVVELTRQRRLVTLLGPGGSGKTTLALQVAHARADAFRDGVWWTELDDLEEAALVPLTIARTLGIREQARRPPTEILAAHLRDAELLLVLDNCEHLIDACRELARELLDHCAGVHLLATSRVSLGLAAQQSFPVAPLAVPDVRLAVDATSLGEIAGVRLFVETYRLSAPEFRLTAENAEAVARIVARLDGIPLAIRLAAAGCAQSVTSTISRVAEQLRDVLPLLRDPDAPDPDALDRPHHQTLEATLDWSYVLLDAAARRLLARLAVFIGGFTWADVEAVCYADGDEPDDGTALTALVRHSLVVPTASAPSAASKR
ncbi:MAG: TIR domain-containing protein, partial [Acidobacteriota bacterium]